MCGIAGILRRHERGAAVPPAEVSIPEAWLDALDAGIAHRGPDGRGRFRDRAVSSAYGTTFDVALVHARLSILDHAGGAQPMVRPTHVKPEVRAGGHRTAVVFNGCIYNHRALRGELAADGYEFLSDHSDTEVLVHGSSADALGLPARLDGMFAYAAWESMGPLLILARDQAGEKPLYYVELGADAIAFASTVGAVVRCMRAVGTCVTLSAAGSLMWLKHGYWPRLPANIHEVPPGGVYSFGAHYPWPTARVGGYTADGDSILLDDVDGLRPAFTRRGLGLSSERVSDAGVHPMLERAVASRLDADVPLGCFLSGGVDSSVVAALAQRAMRAGGRTLKTFTVRMPDARMDETPYANAVAAHLGTDHAVLDCKASAADDLVRLIEQLGLPFGDSSILPTHWVSAAARQHVTVALGGDGGDELFGGYNRYRVNALMHRLRGPLKAARSLPEWAIKPLGGNLARVATAARHHGYDDILSIFRTPQLERLLGTGMVERTLAEQYRGRNVGGDARLDDFGLYLPCDLMRKVDTAAMAVALEVRAPLLAKELVSAALRASLADVEAGEGRKGLLRKIARTLVPAEAIDRRKMGFGVPIGRWFREDFAGLGGLLRDRLGSSEPFPGVPLEFDRAELNRIIDDHMSAKRDHAQRLFALVSLSVWSNWLKRCGGG